MVKKLKNWILSFAMILTIILVVSVVVGKYFLDTGKIAYKQYQQNIKLKALQKLRNSYECPQNEITIEVAGGKVCRGDVAESDYRNIFDTYPISSDGKEDLYAMLKQGTLKEANQILDNNIPIDRYEPIQVDTEMYWDEDPYGERYWKFAYYGLRHLSNLFFAFDQTHDSVYLIKAKEIVLSFIKEGTEKSNAWDDYHAVAFRTMFIEKTWWQLRINNLLTYQDSELILKSIENHAKYLVDPNHYEKGHNHGLNEAGALYSVAANFPKLDKNGDWMKLATKRLSSTLTDVVDADGVLVENSPYYHFYTLEKYWEISKYSKQFNIPISDIYESRLKKMIEYAIYVLQPNNEIPLLGASLKRKILYSGIYKEISQKYPELRFVLTQGKEGKAPNDINRVYQASGEVVMRSSWGDSETFGDQTQIIFDGGPYRTQHSDLDGLSFSLYGAGESLLPDSGLYTYEASDLKNYFHGTSSHNTVTVDNLDQAPGNVSIGKIIEGNGYVSQSGEHELYKGVTHKRTISLIGKRYALIVDDLDSDKDHLYTQLFHTFSGGTVTNEGNTTKVSKGNANVMSIYQLGEAKLNSDVITGQEQPPKGICSNEYEKIIPCSSVEYSIRSKSTRFVTLIEIGQHDPHLSYAYNNGVITIQDSSIITKIETSVTKELPGKIEVTKDTSMTVKTIETIDLNPSNWSKDNISEDRGDILTGNGYIEFKPRFQNKSFAATTTTKLNLSNRDLLLRLNVIGAKLDTSVGIDLSTNNWQGRMSMNLRKSYPDNNNGEWINSTIGKSSLRGSKYGGWAESGTGFNWANIDKIRIRIDSKVGSTASLKISKIATTPGQKKGMVFFVFDDAYESILPAAEVLHKYGYSATTAVIADRVENNQRMYLSIDQLKVLQNDYGWDIVNHSQHHLDAVEAYYDHNDLDTFEEDILSGAEFLINNDLNKAPNWYVYPHGTTNQSIKNIVKKYYKFARTTNNQIESYPFGDPYAIKTISADSSEVSTSTKFTSVLDIEKAISDSQRYRTPLFITFHRIQSSDSDKAGYSIENFTKIVNYINKIKANVYTPSQLDAENGIAQTSITITKKVPSFIENNIQIDKVSTINIIKNKILDIRNSIVSISNSISMD